MLGEILLIVVLVAASAMFLIAEICTPIFGLLTVLSIGCLVGAVAFCFHLSQVAGIVAVVAALIGYPIFVIVAVRVIPRTGLGRRLVLSRGQAPPGDATPEAQGLRSLLGREGVADTLLRPGGAIRVDGQRVIASAESGVILKGTAVKVVRVEGNNVVVRAIATESGSTGQA
jgi:membrane-bound serine protease (ClpP class)